MPRCLITFRWKHAIIVFVLLIIAYFTLTPLFYLGYFSLRTGILSEATWTLSHYRDIFQQPRSWELLWNSLRFAIGSATVALFFGTLMAWISERTNTPGRKFIFGISLIPLIIPSILFAIAWSLLLSPKIGFINALMTSWFGFEEAPFTAYSMASMIWVAGLDIAPLAYLLMVGAFKNMDPSLEEAAAISGARVPQTFFYITLRLASPSIFAVFLLAFIRAIETFEVPAVLGIPAKERVFIIRIFELLREWPPNYGLAASFSMFIFLISLVGIFFYSRMTSKANRYATVTGKAFSARITDLGKWKYVTFSFVLFYLLLVIGFPIFILAWNSLQPYLSSPSLEGLARITFENYAHVLSLPLVSRAAINSLLLGFSSAFLITFLTAISAWVVIKSNLRYRWLIDAMIFLPWVIPGIVMGLALIFVYLTIPIGIYGTLWILMIAYTTRFLPLGMRYLSASMAQISEELEEAAQVAGATWWLTFRHIVLPLVKPGLLAAWTATFIISFRELSSSILLYSPGTEVVAVAIWELLEGGLYPELSALSIILILFLLMIVSLTRWITGKIGIQETTLG